MITSAIYDNTSWVSSRRMKLFSAGLLSCLVLLGGCASLPENTGRQESHALTDTADTRIGKRVKIEQARAKPGESGFHLLGSGLDAFVARVLMIRAADKSLDVQYYLYHNDLTGRLITDELIRAADRGVRVRLLVDDMGLEGRDLGVTAMDLHPNIEIRIINPFSRNTARLTQFVTRLGSVTRRMHNKSMTADNQVTILGGRNIGNEYFEANPDIAFSDLDVVAIGSVVEEVSKSFDLYWNSPLAYPVARLTNEKPTQAVYDTGRAKLAAYAAEQVESEYMKALRSSRLADAIRDENVRIDWGYGNIIYDQPEKLTEDRDRKDLHMSSELGPILKSVSDSMIIFSPYFVPGKKGVENLSKLAEQGVDIRILTNSLASTDVGLVHAGYAKYRKPLLRAGVRLYEMNKKLTREQRKEKKGPGGSSKASLHAKSFVLDGDEVFIGSLNLDPRSVVENTEIGVVIQSEAIAGRMTDWFDENIENIAFRLELKTESDGEEWINWYGIENGKEVKYTVEPHTGFWRRLGIGLASILPIESQL